MTSASLRLMLPAALMLVAGFVGGISWQSHFGGYSVTGGLDTDLDSYQLALSEVLELNSKQQGDLKLLLYYYQQQRDELFAKSLSKVDGEWLELDQRFESLIFARVLDPAQREALVDLRQPQQLDFSTLQR